MFHKTMSIVAVRRFATAITAFALSLSGLVFSPAQANVPVNGSYSCSNGVKDGVAPRYTITGGSVLNGSSCTGAVSIPEGVTSIGNEAFIAAETMTSVNIPTTVTSIGERAFRYARAMTTITIPANVASIGENAFSDTNNLATVIFEPGSKLKSIGNSAFRDAGSLISFTIPEGVTSIGNDAFVDSGKLADISIPASVTSIGTNALASTSSLASITLDPNNQNYSVIDGVLFNKNLTTLLRYPPKKSGTTYSIPPGVTNIGGAFSGSSNLTSITIPSSVATIGDATFKQATALTSLTIPEGVTSIGTQAFAEAIELTSINMPSTVTSIGAEAFIFARKLESITIPTGVTSISNRLFLGTASLQSVTIPEGVITIGRQAFASSALRSITIPASVQTIDERAFQDTTRLTTVTFASGSQLATIGQYAFYEAKKLGSITIPASVTTIAGEVFGITPAWFEIAFLGNAPASVNAAAFAGMAGTKKAYIKTGATGFTATGDPARWNGLEIVVASKIYGGVSFNTKGGSSVGTRLYVESIAEPTTPTRPGYAFVGWTATDGGETTVTFPYAPSETSNITLYAKWTLNTYVLTYDAKGGTAVSNGSFTMFNSVSEPVAPTRNCSTFAGWSATDGGQAISFPYTPGADSNMTLYAKWNLIPCVGIPGATPNSKVVNIPAGVAEATIPATDALPAIKLNLAGATGQVVVTVAPISNPDPGNSPFSAGESTKIVDINVSGITGNVTVCLDGGAGDNLFHFTSGAWVALAEQSYANGQVCGVTSSFSPFTAAIPGKTPVEIAAEQARIAAAAEQARIAAAAEQARIAAAAEQARIAAAELASRTVTAKTSLASKALAAQVGVTTVSPKATLTISVASSSKKICTKSGSKLKTLAAGNCVVTFTVQEPKPKGGKKPKATKTTKTLVVK